jgi:hypothetical protein
MITTHVNRALAGLAIVATLALGALAGTAAAHADTDTVLVELPRCALEDGSDLIEGTCAWIDPDTGNVYLNTVG